MCLRMLCLSSVYPMSSNRQDDRGKKQFLKANSEPSIKRTRSAFTKNSQIIPQVQRWHVQVDAALALGAQHGAPQEGDAGDEREAVPRAHLHGPGVPEDAGGRGVSRAAEEPPTEGAHERGQVAPEDGDRGRCPPQEKTKKGTG